MIEVFEMKKLKILVLSDYAFVKGGAEQVAIASAIGLSKKNHEVVFFSAVGPVSEELSSSNLKEIICLNQSDILDNPSRIKATINGIYNFSAVKELKRLLLRWLPDIIHMHGLSKALSWAPIIIAKSFKIPVIYTIHDYSLLCPNLGIYNFKTQEVCSYYKKGCSIKCMVTNCDKRSYGQKLWRWSRYIITTRIFQFDKKVSAFIAVSSFLKRFFDENLRTKKQVRLIYNPLDIKKIINLPDETVKRSGGNGLVRFLFAGRLSPEKGLELLLGAIKEVKAELIIVGDGELMPLCKKVSRETAGRVKILGYQDRQSVFSNMRSCDCLILPSKWLDPAPLILAEAGYNRLPCIVANHGGLSEFIKLGINGIYFEPGNMSSLKKVMMEIVENPELLVPLKKKSKEIIEQMNLDMDHHTDEILKLYYEILTQK
ncbi:MAG: glycosyltransferase [Candidatus Atribacteria bacterium]|nr:MAG: glycosyltransferase [Candidatus Atribacteria bacterium]